MLFRSFRGISVAASTAKRTLLGVVTETYLRFSRLDQPPDYTDQHFFFGAGFPEDFLAPTVDTKLDAGSYKTSVNNQSNPVGA